MDRVGRLLLPGEGGPGWNSRLVWCSCAPELQAGRHRFGSAADMVDNGNVLLTRPNLSMATRV